MRYNPSYYGYLEIHNAAALLNIYSYDDNPNYWIDTSTPPLNTNQGFFGQSGYESYMHSSENIINMDSSVYFHVDIESIILSIYFDPLGSGEVEVDGSPCQSCPCHFSIPYGDDAEATADPADGYAFAYWEWNDGANSSTNNPETFTMDQALEVKAVFNKTFRDAAAEGFIYDVDDVVGECVVYVRDETGIDYDAFNGNAEGCLDLAREAGYATGTEPRVGAIAVFSSDAVPDVGHVGIVKVVNSATSIKLRHSNWCSPATCHTVSEDDINLITTPVMGYIYPTP